MNFKNLFWRLLGKKEKVEYVATKCSHRTKGQGPVSAYGQTLMCNIPLNKDGSVDFCLDCIGKMSIRCAWCGEAIFVREPITLYTPRPEFKVPEHAVVYQENPLQLIGCLRMGCADSGADRAGFWLPGDDVKGYVRRVPTAYEVILGAQTPSAMIVSRIDDVEEAINPRLIPAGH